MKDRITQVRKQYKLTQKDFGLKIGVKGNTITNYEKGLRNPSDAVIKAICREFSINEHWLRTGEGEMIQTQGYDFSQIPAFSSATPEMQKWMIDFYEIYKDLTPDQQQALNVIAKQLADKKS